ncbi:hypothetical protein [Paracoccus sp. ME4]|uniref:hypothetical protein n=1 Tax=Paracoccus sp. ME4 TaxID=3138066 RepID=UPI00398B6A33
MKTQIEPVILEPKVIFFRKRGKRFDTCYAKNLDGLVVDPYPTSMLAGMRPRRAECMENAQ